MVPSLIIAWLFPAAVMLAVTYAEGMSGGNRHDGMRAAGLLACLFWPLTLPFLVIGSVLHIRASRGKAMPLSRHTDFVRASAD